jgi:aldose 1-epimerase
MSTGSEVFTISAGRLSAQVLSMGASLMNLSVVMPEGPRPVILSLGSPEAYATNPNYLGAIAGRCANRIRGGECVIDGHAIQLDRNEDAKTHLHGGSTGFSRKNWTMLRHAGNAVELRLKSPDGDQGYPGNMEATCLYEAIADARLRITLSAHADATTLANLAAHAYFNLLPGSSVLDHMLQIHAKHYTPVDELLIPDGRVLPVAGTCFDFTAPNRIGARRAESAIGYDHNLVLASAPRPEPQLAAVLASPAGDLAMEIRTTEPGIQLYDGQKLSASPGATGMGLHPFGGCCLEPQRFPDAIHHQGFATALLPAGALYRQVTEYSFVS